MSSADDHKVLILAPDEYIAVRVVLMRRAEELEESILVFSGANDHLCVDMCKADLAIVQSILAK